MTVNENQFPEKPLVNEALPLDVGSMTLSGRHIIEASAGTGKTYNITRVVIRLLLEKQVELKKILIVTFTKAATEELKGRIAKEINSLLDTLQNAPASIDSLFCSFISNIQIDETNNYDLQIQQAIRLLKLASLSLDEASIFTINSFCQRVLKQSAFMRRQSFDFKLVDTSKPFVMQSIQDYFRKNQSNKQMLDAFEFLSINTPSDFYSKFYIGLHGHNTLSLFPNEQHSAEFGNSALNNADAETKHINQPSLDSIHQLYSENEATLIANITAFFSEQVSNIDVFLNFYQNHSEMYKLKIKENTKPTDIDKELNTLAEFLLWLEEKSPDHIPTHSNLAKIFQVKKIQPCFSSKQEAASLLEATKAVMAGIKAINVEKRAKKKAFEEQKKQSLSAIEYYYYECMLAAITDIKASSSLSKLKKETIDHDDTIFGLYEAIEQNNENVINYITESFPYALIDEFQDTDALQYGIFSRCYPSKGKHLLLMIGDPKQAIYAFRGGDVNTYIKARNEADFNWSMQNNYRSSEHMIDAYNILFLGKSLEDCSLSDIKQSEIDAQQNKQTLTQLNNSHSAERLSSLDSELTNSASTPNEAILFGQAINYPWIFKGKLDKEPAFKDDMPGAIHFQVNQDLWPNGKGRAEYKEPQAQSVANEIIRLTKEASVEGKAIEFKDIAILVPGKSDAEKIKTALNASGIPVVYLSEKSDVFESHEAQSIYYALDGILHANNNRKFFRALSSDLFGLSPMDICALQTNINEFDSIKQLFFDLKQIWAKDGILVMLTKLLKTQFKNRRVSVSKERIITNYSHLAELLNEQSKTSEHAYQLLTWLKKQLPNNDAESEDEQETENEQRLESDEDLVKIVTLHGSKGLEYPIVFIPFAGFGKRMRSDNHIRKYFDEDTESNVVVLGGGDKVKDTAVFQEKEEQMRLLYVGITRAIHRCYLGVGKPTSFANTPLFNIVKQHTSNSKEMHNALVNMAEKEPALFALNYYANDSETSNAELQENVEALTTSVFLGETKQAWQLASFSQIAKQDHGKPVKPFIDLSEKERDQSAIIVPTPNDEPNMAYRYKMEKSADTGTLLHNLLEDHDFTEKFKLEKNNVHIQFYLNSGRDCDLGLLESFLDEILETPIPNVDSQASFKLADLPKNSVLKEPEFYFPLHKLTASKLNKLLNAHRQAKQENNADSNLSTLEQTKALIANISSSELNGMMHGFIDLLFEYDGKYYVADYKSNYLGSHPSDYLGASLTHAVQSHLYDLQYLIYSWALDTYLQKRLAGYSRNCHFGGVYYLFLRGMSPFHPPCTGIYFSKIEEETWTLLDKFLSLDTDKVGV